VRLVKDGQSVAISAYSSLLRFGPYAAEGLIDSDRVYKELSAGATIVCQLLQQSIPKTKGFVRALASELGCRVDAHAFITPKSASGLSTHYDTASAFILQVGGSKLWRLYKPLLELPAVDQVFDETSEAKFDLTDEILLQPGDLLYVPRGVPHCPVTIENHSTHVTVVLFPPTWIEVFDKAIEVCTADSRFRAAPPPAATASLEGDDALFSAFEAAALTFLASMNHGDHR
jgi:ribosomal protein L16 Arg81 hydroxylase